jgi:hypothetical protein
MCQEDFIAIWHLLGREKFQKVSFRNIAIIILV